MMTTRVNYTRWLVRFKPEPYSRKPVWIIDPVKALAYDWDQDRLSPHLFQIARASMLHAEPFVRVEDAVAVALMCGGEVVEIPPGQVEP